jgi:SM-20-related protein
MAAETFRVNPDLDVKLLRARFASGSRLRIGEFLAGDMAHRLAEALAADQRWIYLINGTSTVFEIPRATYEALDPIERGQIEQAVFAAAARGFQFRYEAIRVSDDDTERQRSATLLDGFAQFMSSPEAMSFLSSVTGMEDIVFADAQATRYSPGDFLTRHDDNVAGKHRRLAYVLGLTPEWHAEWGGLLLFSNAEGDVVETIVPRFNGLSLFSVPQAHSVSYVAPSSPHARTSVTGWLRSRVPEAS